MIPNLHQFIVTTKHVRSKAMVPLSLIHCLLLLPLCGTALPAMSDSDDMFYYKVIRDLESIDHLCINPIRRIGLIHK